jgi:hypothetical protein
LLGPCAEQASAKRTVRQRRHPAGHALPQRPISVGAFEDRFKPDEADLDLVGGDGRVQVVLQRPDLLRVVIADTDGVDDAAAQKRVQRPGRPGRGALGVGPMQMQQIDGLDAEPTQRALHAVADPAEAGVIACRRRLRFRTW